MILVTKNCLVIKLWKQYNYITSQLNSSKILNMFFTETINMRLMYFACKILVLMLVINLTEATKTNHHKVKS